MHLHGEIVVGVDILDQQREAKPVLLVVLLAHQVGEIDLEELVEVVFGEEAVGDLRLVADDAGNFPALAALFHRANIVVQEGFESFAAPYFLFKDGDEFQGV